MKNVEKIMNTIKNLKIWQITIISFVIMTSFFLYILSGVFEGNQLYLITAIASSPSFVVPLYVYDYRRVSKWKSEYNKVYEQLEKVESEKDLLGVIVKFEKLKTKSGGDLTRTKILKEKILTASKYIDNE